MKNNITLNDVLKKSELVETLVNSMREGITKRMYPEPMVARKSHNENTMIIENQYTEHFRYKETIVDKVEVEKITIAQSYQKEVTKDNVSNIKETVDEEMTIKYTISYVCNGYIVDVHIITTRRYGDVYNYLYIDVFGMDKQKNEYLLGSVKYNVICDYSASNEYNIDFYLLPNQNLQDVCLSIDRGIDSIIKGESVEPTNILAYVIDNDDSDKLFFRYIEPVVNYLIADYNIKLNYSNFININRAYFLNTMLYRLLTNYNGLNMRLPDYNRKYIKSDNESMFFVELISGKYKVKLEDNFIDKNTSLLVISFIKYSYSCNVDHDGGCDDISCRGEIHSKTTLRYTIEYNHDGSVEFRLKYTPGNLIRNIFSNEITVFGSIDSAREMFCNKLYEQWNRFI